MADRPYWLLEELEASLEKEALRRPCLIAFDDLQWADGPTLAALPVLVSRTADLPIVWLASSRPCDPRAAVVATFDRLLKSGAHRLELGALADSAVSEIVKDVMGGDPEADLISMADTARGNPFALLELLSGLDEEGLVRIAGGRAHLVKDQLPRRVRENMRERLERMSALTCQVASVATAMGPAFTITAIARALGQPPTAVVGPVDDLLRADILATSDGRLAFRHELIRQAVLDQLPEATRHLLLRHSVDVLLAGGASAVEVAPLLAESAEPGDRLAVTVLAEAARALAASQPATAADLYLKSLACADDRHPARAHLTAQAALTLHTAGRVDDAGAFTARALHEALPPDQEAEIRLGIAGMLLLSPDVRCEASRSALARQGVSRLLRARHLGSLVLNLCNAGRLEAARAEAVEAEAEVEATGDPVAAFTLELGLAGIDHLSGDFAAATVHALASEHATATAGKPELAYTARTRRCDGLAICDRLDEAVQLATEGLAQARQSHAPAVRCWDVYTGRYLFQAGRLADASAVLEGLFTSDAAVTIDAVPEAAGLLALAQLALHMDNRAQTRDCHQLARTTLATATAPEVRRHAAWLLALQAMADGDAASAHAWLQSMQSDDDHALLPLLARDPCDHPQLVRIALRAGDTRLAQETVETIEDIQRRNPEVRTIEGSAAHARGLLRADPGQLRDAVQLFSTGPRPLPRASALEDLGGGLLAGHETAEAVDAYSEALEIYAAVGATWDARRVRGRLRRLGIRRRLVADRRAEHGWSSLTQAELFVIRRVAHGLTNREVAAQLFVSPHTVSTHLRHAFQKMGVNSRVELTRVVLAHEPQNVGQMRGI